MSVKSYRVLVKDATQAQMVEYLRKVQGLGNSQPHTTEAKLRAKLAEFGIEDDDYINLPDDGEADREEARLAKQEASVSLDGDTLIIEVVGYERAKAKATEMGGVLIGTNGKPLRYTEFTNWPKGLIMIPRTGDFDGKHDVPVAPNGRQMFIPRGRDVEVAEPYILALMDAEGIEYVQEESGGAMTPTKIQRHSLVVKQLPTYTIAVPAEARAA